METKHIIIAVVVAAVLLVIKFAKHQPRANSATKTDIEAALKDGNKILAMKYYRKVHGVGLTEAKAAIDAMEPEQ